jgi:valyl-tRNA synthetase
MYYFRYRLVNSTDYLIVATTRPETMFGDVALFCNPLDKRFKKFIGSKVINPVNNEEIPILSDSHVRQDFGTGLMKCTPAHDFNDYVLGQTHSLKSINVMNYDGTMNEKCLKYQGLSREMCRENLVKDLAQLELVEKVEDYETVIPYSERTNTIIEPLLSEQ